MKWIEEAAEKIHYQVWEDTVEEYGLDGACVKVNKEKVAAIIEACYRESHPDHIVDTNKMVSAVREKLEAIARSLSLSSHPHCKDAVDGITEALAMLPKEGETNG